MTVANRLTFTEEHKAAREHARQRGDRRFSGDPCPRGHERIRLTCHGACAECQRLANAARPKKERPSNVAKASAQAAGENRYHGKPCPRGHGTERHVSTRRCVVCSKLHPGSRRQSPEHMAAVRKARTSRPEFKAQRTAAMVEKYRSDPTFRLRARMASRMRKAMLRHGHDKARRSWVSLVGYTPEHLRAHIERQFLRGMSWDNAHLWHVDHILPIASFGATEPEGDAFRACWALSNLRPLWKRDNMLKGAKREHLL